ncbi:MAG TPA: glycosyltransferase family 2 protein [Oculatellaceae cyanobacterium]|jgi:glycosyltransferase involved in cell wall biosynthesis
MTPFVSIIVTCFNQARYIEQSVKSVLSQTFPDLECLIVDDGSTDNTREIAEQLIASDSRVKYFYKTNGGVSSSRNFGFSKTQGVWIQFLDGDDWIHEDKTRFQLSHLKDLPPENIIFYCDYERVFIDGESKIVKTEQKVVGALNREQLIERLLLPDFLADSPFPLLQQCLLLHKSVFEHTMFDERLKALQDRDFCLEFLVTGVNFIYTPMIGAYYTKHQSNRTNNWFYMKEYYILFYEITYNKHQHLLALCQRGIQFLLEDALREKEQKNFERLLNLAQTPLYLLDRKIKITHPSLLKIFYPLRLLIPNFLLYEKYRGARTKNILKFLSKKLVVIKPDKT